MASTTTPSRDASARHPNTGKPWSREDNVALLMFRDSNVEIPYERLESIFGRSSLALRLQLHELTGKNARKQKRRAQRAATTPIKQENEATPRPWTRTTILFRKGIATPRNPDGSPKAAPPAPAPTRPPVRLNLSLNRFRAGHNPPVRSGIKLNLSLARFRTAPSPPQETQAWVARALPDARTMEAAETLLSVFDSC